MTPKLNEFFAECREILLGKDHEIKLAFACILARGHLLIEDIPGVGKTTLVHLLAKGLGLDFSRIQFTSDLLPADIIGSLIFESRSGTFKLHKGPVFAHIVLADELNRATPKTQSALLQAMEEHTVSIENESHRLPEPFFVFATQNPHEQAGTFLLPESQIDRFLIRISLGYPDRAAEKRLLTSPDRRELIETMKPHFNAVEILAMQAKVAAVTASAPLIEYVQNLLEKSRSQSGAQFGLSPRAGLALLSAARAWAFLEGRDMVLPEDVQAVGVSVMSHRLACQGDADIHTGVRLANELIRSVAVD